MTPSETTRDKEKLGNKRKSWGCNCASFWVPSTLHKELQDRLLSFVLEYIVPKTLAFAFGLRFCAKRRSKTLGCASTEGIWIEFFTWKIQVIESMVSGLCR